MLLYLFGGQERHDKLSEMFKTCKANGVAIYILTNNSTAERPIFKELLDKFIGLGEYKLYYTGTDRDGKGHFLSILPEFESMRMDEQKRLELAKPPVLAEPPKKSDFYDLYGFEEGGSRKRKRTKRRKSKRTKTKKKKSHAL